jgi:hypothetical protein
MVQRKEKTIKITLRKISFKNITTNENPGRKIEKVKGKVKKQEKLKQIMIALE